jgi:hypothetical protein
MEDVDAEWMERVEKAEVEERYRRGGDLTITSVQQSAFQHS